MRLDSPSKSLRARTLLPNEPRLLNPDLQRRLTERFLLPKLAEIEHYLLTIRKQLDSQLRENQPMKLGKPYPLGQCLEIALAVRKRLLKIKRCEIPSTALIGFDTLRKFRSNGGVFRQVWGDLRGQYFQNAFQLGTLYVDVANDTVVPTKPKVEILPFEDAQFIPISNFEHFRRIARRYWAHEIYPNHVFPELAPYCPFIHVSTTGEFQLHNISDYMLFLAHSHGYQSSAVVLRDSPMSQDLFEQIQLICQQNLIQTASSLKHGKELSLRYCQQYREKRWHLKRETINQFRVRATRINLIFSRVHEQQLQKEITMSTITIDNIEYALENLSEEAKAQIQSIQFVEQELARLQAKTAALQTARNAYLVALKQVLPE